ncbi:hypothetical protein FB451DRAFT_1130966 [Mycena latifolia]|nr:hypothetical protein FB451DRAFT_1130966 [Mycena latifolia]
MHPGSQASLNTRVSTVCDRPTRLALRARKVDLDAEIAAMELALQSLRAERDILERQLAYPVHTLPNEITSEIFVNFLPAYPIPPPLSGILSPVVLGHICREWREIAFSTPRLWRAIEIVFIDEEDLPKQLDILKTWLLRSGECPLSISLEYPETNDDSGDLTPFIDATLAHCTRWDVMKFVVPVAYLRLIRGGMPMLRQLTVGPSLCPYENPPGVSIDGTFDAFSGAPKLDAVVLTDGFAPCSVHLPWSQLTSITADLLLEYEAYLILRHAPTLVYFEAILTDSNDIQLTLALGEAVPPLLHLESLILNGEGSPNSEHSHMLGKLALPALRVLELSARWLDPGADPCDIILAFIAKSKCTLDTLRVREAAPMAFVEFRYRATFPSIREIVVDIL